MKNKLLLWEIGGYFFIGFVGAALHYTFELSNYQNMLVAFFSAVNESTWEHLKMVFWPGLLFALVQYTYVRDVARNYLLAKTVSFFIMPLVIIVGWYVYTPITGRSIFPVDLALFYIAILLGQMASYKLLTAPPLAARFQQAAMAGMAVLLFAFSTFTFYPPPISLFEHFDLRDTGRYGILTLAEYEPIRVFRNR